MSDDPWKHRAANMRCRTCMFFVVKALPEPEPRVIVFKPRATGATAVLSDALAEALRRPGEVVEFHSPPVERVGRCRRRAPTMDGYPVVFTNDWCGDHKLDETKT